MVRTDNQPTSNENACENNGNHNGTSTSTVVVAGTATDTSTSTNRNRKAFLKVNETEIYFEEDWEVGIGGGLWSTGLCLSKYFIEHCDLLRHNLKRQIPSSSLTLSSTPGIRAIELGSGNGLLSCVLAGSVGDLIDTLYITDLADHLDLMKQTALANAHILTLQNGDDNHNHDDDNIDIGNSKDRSTSTSNKKCKCHVVEHAFGSSTNQPLGKFDFIFGSDVAYRDHLHQPLISSLLQLSHNDTLCIIGVTMTDTKPIFFTMLWEAGFRYDRMPDHLMSHEFRGTMFGLFVITKRLRL